jgi:prepilin-type N-terminal cleavage/methylation domain-containing protein
VTSRKQHAPGFTLAELMVSMAVGSIVLLAAATLLGGSGDSYERVGGSVATEREARALITQLGADLGAAHFHKDAVIQLSFGKWPADQFGFLSLQPSEAQADGKHIGDLCAVNYYLKDLPIGGKTVRCLMRGFRDSKDTFEALESDQIAQLFTPQDDIDEPVAFNVVSFQARPMTRGPGGVWANWTPDGVTSPEAVDVRLVIVRRDLAGRLKNASDWDNAGGGGRLGDSADADRNRDLEVYGAMLRYGNHETL